VLLSCLYTVPSRSRSPPHINSSSSTRTRRERYPLYGVGDCSAIREGRTPLMPGHSVIHTARARQGAAARSATRPSWSARDLPGHGEPGDRNQFCRSASIALPCHQTRLYLRERRLSATVRCFFFVRAGVGRRRPDP
jgi:hypothetical protein